MNNNIIKGIVLDKTINSIKIDKIWIKFFKPELMTGINKNDNVIVEYKDKEKDNKVYHNGISIKKLMEETVIYNKPIIQKTELSEQYKPKLTYDKELTSTDKNCILMTAKDIYLSEFNNKVSQLSLDELVKRVKEIRLKL